MKKGKLIVIEGSDGAGKARQTELLLKSLKKQNKKAEVFDFPRYEESVFGNLVGRCVSGEFGDFLALSPYISSLPYILDRVSAKEKLVKALARGHVISNRYTPSNLAHQSAKLSPKKREELVKFIEYGEYDELKLPRPDLVLYLNVSPRISADLILKKKKRVYLSKTQAKDQFEDNLEYQKQVSNSYKAIAKGRRDWTVIDCSPKGKLLSPEEVHALVLKAVKGRL